MKLKDIFEINADERDGSINAIVTGKETKESCLRENWKSIRNNDDNFFVYGSSKLTKENDVFVWDKDNKNTSRGFSCQTGGRTNFYQPQRGIIFHYGSLDNNHFSMPYVELRLTQGFNTTQNYGNGYRIEYLIAFSKDEIRSVVKTIQSDYKPVLDEDDDFDSFCNKLREHLKSIIENSYWNTIKKACSEMPSKRDSDYSLVIDKYGNTLHLSVKQLNSDDDDVIIFYSEQNRVFKEGLIYFEFGKYQRQHFEGRLYPECRIGEKNEFVLIICQEIVYVDEFIGDSYKKPYYYDIEPKNSIAPEIFKDTNSESLVNTLMQYWRDDIEPKCKKWLETSPDVITTVMQIGADFRIDKKNIDFLYKIVDAKRQYDAAGQNKETEIPNFAFLGPAGVGKTTLADRIAKLFGKEIYSCTPSDLKGAYVGHTLPKLVELFKSAGAEYTVSNGEKRRESTKTKIILIDEVYGLYGDQFGREAAEILLPIMSGQRKKLEYKDDKSKMITTVDVSNIHIWIAGYEIPTRQMLQKNLGLYRRFEILPLVTPSVDRLMEAFENGMKKSDKESGTENIIGLNDQEDLSMKENESVKKAIREFIAWATSPERAPYFANYAGVEKLCDYVKSIRRYSPDKQLDMLSDDLDRRKREIEAQYRAALLMPENDRQTNGIVIPVFKTSADFEEIKVIGNEGVKDHMDSIVNMIFNKDEYRRAGVSIPKGVLFVGPPGTGKSYMAKYMAWKIQNNYRNNKDKDHRVGFIPLVATELDTPDKVDKLFETAKEFDDCLIFIDEIDAIGKSRNMDRNAYESSMLRLMTNMDGFDSATGILILAATNAPDKLDPALKRPGRFDGIIEIDRPDEKDRGELLTYYLGKTTAWKKLAENSTDDKEPSNVIDIIQKQTAGLSAAEIKTIVNNAAIALSENKQCSFKIWEEELINQIDTYLIGEKKGDSDNSLGEVKLDTEKNQGASGTAVHEVGHAIVRIMEYGGEPFDEITVVPRGNALGYVKNTQSLERENTKENILKDVRIALAGRAAEEIIYGKDQVSAGACQDIQQATNLVRKMVFVYGMSNEIGPVALMSSNSGYLGGESKYLCSENMREKAEEEVRAILIEQYNKVRDSIKKQKECIVSLSQLILEKKTMNGKEFLENYYTESYRCIQKEVVDVMGGKIMDLPEIRIRHEALAEGEAKGEAIGEAKGRAERDRLRSEIEQLKADKERLETEISRLKAEKVSGN